MLLRHCIASEEYAEMSMEIYTLSDRQLNSLAEWQKAINAENFSLDLSVDRPFPALGGFIPVKVVGSQTGFECDHWDARDIQQTYADLGFGHEWRYCLAFRWGADFKACLGAYMAAAAYASATNGVVLDCEQGALLGAHEAVLAARDVEQQLPAMEQKLREIMQKLASKT
jgi:hypothetical protein